MEVIRFSGDVAGNGLSQNVGSREVEELCVAQVMRVESGNVDRRILRPVAFQSEVPALACQLFDLVAEIGLVGLLVQLLGIPFDCTALNAKVLLNVCNSVRR